VNNRNSRSPRTEQEIVAEHSYGRQLGHLTEAVAKLIERTPDSKQVPEFNALLDLHEKIRQIKERSKAERLNRLEADLARLRDDWREEYDRIVARLTRDSGK
jgi:hypothetical protein